MQAGGIWCCAGWVGILRGGAAGLCLWLMSSPAVVYSPRVLICLHTSATRVYKRTQMDIAVYSA